MPVILNIEMPKCCDECPLFDDSWDYPTCYATGNSRGYNFDIRHLRMPDCPLTRVTESVGSNVDRCVMCGEIVPEGTQVCKTCIKKIMD
jgi:hypothetical protein